MSIDYNNFSKHIDWLAEENTQLKKEVTQLRSALRQLYYINKYDGRGHKSICDNVERLLSNKVKS